MLCHARASLMRESFSAPTRPRPRFVVLSRSPASPLLLALRRQTIWPKALRRGSIGVRCSGPPIEVAITRAALSTTHAAMLPMAVHGSHTLSSSWPGPIVHGQSHLAGETIPFSASFGRHPRPFASRPTFIAPPSARIPLSHRA
ncbi:hypothetical protein N7462_002156 [Penicillium macrosclerotiorum]|uniref:uncharacterized protein n=1 Tax=Penicillium macrosclerotiorum TaxID=303699 RepID=UPI00254795C1|nr:uncharacterized protein N7462_002156 [Penicillium macrosclerotiorum]KAJ5692733.1 hypothetical protein N7462_002156 [Penicillium macrosclerotiorum]